eukprot:SAG31_NODE_600_length_13647_cov_3.894376_8_plen_98_part_00
MLGAICFLLLLAGIIAVVFAEQETWLSDSADPQSIGGWLLHAKSADQLGLSDAEKPLGSDHKVSSANPEILLLGDGLTEYGFCSLKDMGMVQTVSQI